MTKRTKKSEQQNRLNFKMTRVMGFSLKMAGIILAPAVSLFIYLHQTGGTQEASVDHVNLEEIEAEQHVLSEPEVGLRLIEQYMNPKSENELASIHLWKNAADDFRESSKQENAPNTWQAAVFFCEGQIAIKEKKLSRAASLFQQAVVTDPQWAPGYNGLAGVLSRQGNYQEATVNVRIAERLAPNAVQPVLTLAEILAIQEKYEDANIEFGRALEMTDDLPFILAERALVYHAMKDFDSESMKYAKMSLQKDPHILSARIILTEIAFEQNRPQDALKQMKVAILHHPKNATARILYAESLAASGDPENKALEEYKRALASEATGDLAGYSARRLKIIKEAVAKGKLPPSRLAVVQKETSSGKKTAGKVKRTKASKPNRSSRTRVTAPPSPKDDRTRNQTREIDEIFF